MKRYGLLKRLRAQAILEGRNTYGEGLACVRGHTVGYGVKLKACIACNPLFKKKWNDNNREFRIQQQKARVERNPEGNRESHRKYRKKNPGKFTGYKAVRRAKQQNAAPTWLDRKECEAIYAQAKRLSEWIGIKYHVDHIVPLSNSKVCGLHVPWNLQIIPAWQNLKKNNKFDVD